MSDSQLKYERALAYVHDTPPIYESHEEHEQVFSVKEFMININAYKEKYMKFLVCKENGISVYVGKNNTIYEVLKQINLECLNYLVKYLGCQKENIIRSNMDLFLRKNKDYGNSFQDFGFLGIMVRLNDKINRMKTLHSNNHTSAVPDESFVDTVQDLYNYTLLGLMYV